MPNWSRATLNPTFQGPRGGGREGVKTLPSGMRGYGLKDWWKEDAAKPLAAQRAGGIIAVGVLSWSLLLLSAWPTWL